jgi:hypothetical protein
VFTTYVDDFNFTHIVFGDNTSGRIPAANAQIYATYRYGVGAQANAIPAKKITTIVPRAGFFEAWQVTVTNLESPTGGADPESVESLRHTVPRAGSRIRSRAVTLNDYADLAMQVPGVAKSVAYGTVYTAVKVWIGPTLSSSQDTVPDELMARLCANVEQTMKDKVLIGSTVVAGPLVCDDLWNNVFIRVNIQVAEVFNRLSVRDAVDSVIRKLMAYSEMDFGTRITLGGVYRAVLTVQGVEWAEVTWLSTIRPPSESGGPYVEPTITPTGPPSGGPVQKLFTSRWKFESITSPAEPTATYYRLVDDAISGDPEFMHIAISRRDTTIPSAGSDNRTTDLASLDVGDHILMSNPANGAWWDYVIRTNVAAHAGAGAPATPGYDEWEVTLARQSTATPPAPTAGTAIDFTFVRYSPTPISIGEVADINTSDLKIPRIDPVKYEEPPESYPSYYTEFELIHDGLWITADGGLAHT